MPNGHRTSALQAESSLAGGFSAATVVFPPKRLEGLLGFLGRYRPDKVARSETLRAALSFILHVFTKPICPHHRALLPSAVEFSKSNTFVHAGNAAAFCNYRRRDQNIAVHSKELEGTH